MRARDLIEQKNATVVSVRPTDTLHWAVTHMLAHSVGGLPVLGMDGAAIGFLSERDVLRALHEHGPAVLDLHVREVMQHAPLVSADESLEEVMRQMTARRQRHLIVHENGSVIGIISLGDIVKHRLTQLETETGVLRDYLAGQRARH